MLVFMALWSVVVYSPMAHMVWGQGGLLNASLGGAFPTLDFAGGTVVHVTSGVSALVCALYLGKRLGYPNESAPPHSVVLSFTGACLLWVGWFGFNAGSALSAGSLASSAFVATHFAAATAAAGWTLAEWKISGKPSALGAISGAVAGLVAITPAAGFVRPMPAMLIGLITGIFCYFMVARVKARFGYEWKHPGFRADRGQRAPTAESVGWSGHGLVSGNCRDAWHPVRGGQTDRPARLAGARNPRARPVPAWRRRLRLGDFHVATGFSAGAMRF